MRPTIGVLLAVTALGGGALVGCGGGDDAPADRAATTGTSTPTTPRSTPSAPAPPRALRLPSDVPTVSRGVATDAVSARVIRKWSGALSGGDIERAARFFALPSKVQNGTPVVTLDTAEKRLVFNVTFPCGAEPKKLEQAAGGYTIVDFELTERVGGDCGTGTGGTARCAIRVRDGHISDWYRIPDRRAAPAPAPGAPPADTLPGTRIA